MTTLMQDADKEIFRLLADYFSLRVLDTLRDGSKRFNEVLRILGDANPVTLVDRLKKLESAGVIERQEETLDRQSVTYTLTDIGAEALPIISAYRAFAKKLNEKRSKE